MRFTALDLFLIDFNSLRISKICKLQFWNVIRLSHEKARFNHAYGNDIIFYQVIITGKFRLKG